MSQSCGHFSLTIGYTRRNSIFGGHILGDGRVIVAQFLQLALCTSSTPLTRLLRLVFSIRCEEAKLFHINLELLIDRPSQPIDGDKLATRQSFCLLNWSEDDQHLGALSIMYKSKNLLFLALLSSCRCVVIMCVQSLIFNLLNLAPPSSAICWICSNVKQLS